MIYLHCVVIVWSPVNQSSCVGDTVTFTCVVIFTSGSPGPAIWATNNGANDASRLPGHSVTDDSDGLTAPANVTNVLTVTNVSISNNGADYICGQGFNTISDTAYLLVFGELLIYTFLCSYNFAVIIATQLSYSWLFLRYLNSASTSFSVFSRFYFHEWPT